MTYAISQVLVVFGGACLVSSFYMKEKYKQLIFLLLASVFIGVHFFLLNALVAGALEILCLIRTICLFIHEKKYLKKFNIYLTITFSVLSVIIGYLTFASWIICLPVLGFILFTIFNSIDNQTFSRIAYTLHAICYGTYSFFIGSYTAFAFYIISLICSIVMLIIAKYLEPAKIETSNKSNSTNQANSASKEN